MFGIIKNRKIWFIFSGILIAASFLSLIFWGLKFGIDFTGGSLLEVRWQGNQPELTSIQETINPFLEREFVVQPTSDNGTVFRLESITEEKHQDIKNALQEKFGSFEELRFESIGPVIGQELASKSIWALIIMFIGIIIYIAWSFRKVSLPVSSWKYGVITVFTGFHDVIIPIGLFSVLGKFYGTEINTTLVAAILTILGYSISDTIVVLDRVRENLKKGFDSFENTIEISVHQTISRSINTSVTTLLAMVAIYFFGGPSVKDFALALIVGIATGTYSSIFIASPVLLVWHKFSSRRQN